MPKRLTSDDPNIPFPRDPEYLQMMYNRLRQLEQDIQNGVLVKAVKPEQIKIPYEEIVGLYNSICVSLPRCLKITDARRRSIKARYNEDNGIKDFEEVFQKAEKSDFLTGREPSKSRKNWKADFDSLMGSKMFQKTLEGGHDNADDGKERRNWDDAFEKMALNVKSPPDTGISDRPKENIT